MQTNKRIAGAVSAVALMSGLFTAAGATTAGAADGCTNNSGLTQYTAFGTQGQGFELRRNGSGNNTCVWGRIVGGSPGMHIWVDRSNDGGRTWQGHLGEATITSGGSVWTEAFADRNGQVARTCGDSGYNTPIRCTGWY
ncbi:glycosyl hydrolase [Streptomyces sp. NPDC058305]|uniref:glycosyl hydrolase n=1 Tax=Streptomyces sp. NPDC058305 TaxID=3346438 RepID=UPI0036E42847